MYDNIPLPESKLAQISKTLYNDLRTEIFNDVRDELIANVKIGLSVDKPVVGRTILKHSLVLEIPSGEYVSIFHVNLSLTSGMIYTNTIDPYYRGQWIDGVELLSLGISIDIYTSSGVMLSKSSLKVKSSLVNNNTLYISIPTETFNDFNLDFTDEFYITMYKDSTEGITPKTATIYSYRTGTSTDLIDIITEIQSMNLFQDKLYINGFLYDQTQGLELIDNLSTDNEALYIDYLKDQNITKSMSVNLNTLKEYSTCTDPSKDKYLIHIRKELSDKTTYTLEQLDICIVNTDLGKGIKIPFISQEIIYQVSNSDYGLSKAFVLSIITLLGTGTYRFDINIKPYNKLNPLTQNYQFNEYLYTYFNDDDIQSLLTESFPISELLSVFNAPWSTQTQYIRSLYNMPDNTNPYEIAQWSKDTYGYYGWCVKYARFQYTITIEDASLKTYQIEKSLFYQNELTSLRCFKNNVLTQNISWDETRTEINITINDTLSINDEILLQVLPFNKSYNNIITALFGLSPLAQYNSILSIFNSIDYASIKPTSIENTLHVDLDTTFINGYNNKFYRYKIYRKIDTPSDILTYNSFPIDCRYEELDRNNNNYFTYSENPHNNILSWEFTPNSYGEEFILVPVNYYTIHIDNPHPYIVNNFICFILEYNEQNIVEIPFMQVFVDGYEKYELQDYFLKEFKNSDGTVSGYQIIIQTDENISNNNVDIFISTLKEMEVLSEKGFGKKTVISCNNRLNYHDDRSLSYVSVDGKVYGADRSKIYSDLIDVYDDVESKPYRIKYLVPSILYTTFYTNDNNNLILSTLMSPEVNGHFNSREFEITEIS